MVATGAQVPLLDVRDLAVRFGGLDVVEGVDLRVGPGEAIGIVGESGCGKSVSAQAIMRLLPGSASVRAARLDLEGKSLLSLTEAQMRPLRGAAMSMIFQEPMTALNPVLTVGRQITETLERHFNISRREARERATDLLARVGIPAPARRLDDFPHQLSGGMRQRVMIAIAISCRPRLLFADEPTTALDVTIQAQILELLRRLQEEDRMGIVLISHDLGVVSSFVDRVSVMYAGRVVEDAEASALFARPSHPYTAGLLASRPTADRDQGRLKAIPGVLPPPFARPSGCRFRTRCAQARDACATLDPPLDPVGTDHRAACPWPLGSAVIP